VNAAPLDWIARYNLGVAEAQAGAAGRALGETAAALAQAPRQQAVRANATALAAAAPEADAALAPLLRGRLAPLAPPATWQLLLIAGAVLASAGIAIGRRRTSLALFAAGCTTIAVAGVALAEQGVFADRRVAMVANATVLHALPTDAEPAKDAPALAVGRRPRRARLPRLGADHARRRRDRLGPAYRSGAVLRRRRGAAWSTGTEPVGSGATT
jgi:hypothetical protein